MRKFLKKISIFLNLINKIFGYFCALFVILMAITVFVVVIFMLGAGFTYFKDEHVRIDILYTNYSKKYKKFVNFLGNIFFLIPFLFITWKYSFPFVLKSFQMREVSREAGGLEMVFILKSAILFFVILMFIQVISKTIYDFQDKNYDS